MSDQYDIFLRGKGMIGTGETCTDTSKVSRISGTLPVWLNNTKLIEYIKLLNKMTKQEREEFFNGDFTKEVWCVEKESLDEFLNDIGGGDE